MSLFLVGLRCSRHPTPLIPSAGTRHPFCLAGTHPPFSRSFSSASCAPFSSLSSLPQHQVYISQSTNPYFNLTFEDWLFRHAPVEKPLLLVYRNVPCVIIGRNQNPWAEINFQALRSSSDVSQEKKAVPFIRRRSGGGTVYHDLGNTNFSIHLPRSAFDRRVTARIVVQAVQSLGIDVHVNDRNDICVGSRKIWLLPFSSSVSGSAYKIAHKRAYHHGTMLISTNLVTLGDTLRITNKDNMVTKGVASVPSPVCRLHDFDTSVTHEAFTDAVVREFHAEYGIDNNIPCCVVSGDEEALLSIEYIRKGMAELPSWEWLHAQTPEFTYTVRHSFAWGDVTAKIHAKHGIIQSCTMQIDNTSLSAAALERLIEFSASLGEKRYDPMAIATVGTDDGPTKDIMAWLQHVMAS